MTMTFARSRLCVRALAAAAVGVFAASAQAQTLAAVKQRGELACGVSKGIEGFSIETAAGWSGFDVDFCRALAAAVLGDPGKVRFVPLDTESRFAALQSGAIDVLSRNSTWTMTREVELKLVFPATTYFDGQGFLVRKSRQATSAMDLDGAKVCVRGETTTEANLADYFRSNDLYLQPIRFAQVIDVINAYDAGQCDVLTSDVSQLYADRLRLTVPGDHVILPDLISKEPLGPAVRQGDDQWLNVVKWTVFALINAEELGVTSGTLDQSLQSKRPEVRRLLGTEGNVGDQAGLTHDWAVRVIRSVGNYAEIFERNLGDGSELGIPRGLNELWTNGGILYAPPIR
jgi:general L-amino acid transport system substrate-binding protein